LGIDVNGHHIADFSISERQTICGVIERRFIEKKAAVCIRLSHPDSARPIDFPEFHINDDRRLSFAYEALVIEEIDEREEDLVLSLRNARFSDRYPGQWQAASSPEARAYAPMSFDFLNCFQSAGNDCEFGFVQRQLGLEPLGLLRFASISIDDLTRALKSRFSEIGNPDRLDIFVPHDEPEHDYLGHDRGCEIIYHTRLSPQSVSAEDLRQKEVIRLKRLAVKFLEDIQGGRHIFVVKYKNPPEPVQLARLVAAFHRIAPATIFWVQESADPRMAGTARWLIPGVIAGYVDRIDTTPLKNISFDSWVSASRAAYLLWTNSKGSSQ